MARAIDVARRLDIETCGIDGRCRTAGTCKSSLDVLCNLVESDDEDDLLRTPGDGSHTVAIAVDVHDHSIFGDGIGTGEIDVGGECLEIDGLLLFGRRGKVAVEHFERAAIAKIAGNAKVADGHRAAPRHTAPIVDELGNLLHSLGSRGTIEGLDVATMKIMNERLCKALIPYFL